MNEGVCMYVCVKLHAQAGMNWKKTAATRSRDLPMLKFVSERVITDELMDNKANLAEFTPPHPPPRTPIFSL